MSDAEDIRENRALVSREKSRHDVKLKVVSMRFMSDSD
jgi:hypothetical protein